MENMVRYPVGVQSFKTIRERDCLYVDKTRFLEKIINNGGQYFFLSRPRRFGKSLFLSTMKCFFEGKRELFKNLYIDTIKWDWDTHPVFYLDFNIESYATKETLDQILENHLAGWEKEYDVKPEIDNFSVRFGNVLRAAYSKTGKRVVVLIDEYDKPLVNSLNDKSNFEFFRDRLYTIYSNFKSGDDHIRLVFLTGVSRFGKLSVFPGLNNIRDISFSNDFSDICGISEKELSQYFQEGIQTLARKRNVDFAALKAELKRYYDGYRFSEEGSDIYNPYSLLNVMEEKKFKNYWILSGQPTLLVNQLKRFNVDIAALLKAKCTQESLTGLDLETPRPLALLYQTGYLTIKDYDERRGIYTLGIPNREVEEGLFSFLLPFYANLHDIDPRFFVSSFIDEFESGDVEAFMNRLKSMFASIPYNMEMNREQNIHNALLMLMMLVGLEVKTEYRTSNGRIDLFIKTKRFYYIIELKLDGSSHDALKQIDEKNYALPFQLDSRKVIKIGVNFSSETKTISDWVSSSENL